MCFDLVVVDIVFVHVTSSGLEPYLAYAAAATYILLLIVASSPSNSNTKNVLSKPLHVYINRQ